MKNSFKLSPPWVTFVKEVEILFGDDPAIRIDYDDTENTVKMYVAGVDKADALTRILPAERAFGNVVLKIDVIPENAEMTLANQWRLAFAGNPAFSYMSAAEDPEVPFSFNYVVFKNKVVQFYNDELNDINGNKNTLYQDIARDIFPECTEVNFCTDVPSNPGKYQA